DTLTGQALRVIDVQPVKNAQVFGAIPAIAVSADGSRLVVCSSTGVRIFDAGTLASIQELKPSRSSLRGVALSNGPTYVTGAWDGSVSVWTEESDKVQRTWSAPEGLLAIALAPDASLVATATQANVVHVWEVETGLEKSTTPPFTREAFALAFSPDGV